MEIRASMPADELITAVRELLPLRIDFADIGETRRWLRLDEATEITFVPRVGLDLVCSGTLHFPLPILPDDYTIRRVHLAMRPSIAPGEDGDVLAFNLAIQALDVASVPAFVDASILKRVNAKLTEATTTVAWSYTRTLTRRITLGWRVTLVEDLALTSSRGTLAIDDDGIVMTVHVGLSFPRAPLKTFDIVEPAPEIAAPEDAAPEVAAPEVAEAPERAVVNRPLGASTLV